MLTGSPARLQDEHGAVRIETDVTDAALSRWPRLLAVLSLGTEYGVTNGRGTRRLAAHRATRQRPRP